MRSRRRKNSRLGMPQPSANNSGGMNSSRNSFGSRSTCKPKLGTLIAAPSAIWVHGNGNRAKRTTGSEEHTSELQSLMRISSAVFGLKKKTAKTDREPEKHK